MVKKYSACITKEASKVQSLTLPPRNEYASCVNVVFKVSAEAELTQNTPASVLAKFCVCGWGLYSWKLCFWQYNICQTSLELRKLCQ